MTEEPIIEVTQEAAIQPPQPLVYEHTINGHKIVLKRRVEGKDARGLAVMVSGIADVLNEPEKLAPIGAALIESWEFAGSPQDAESYGALDVFDEVFPLAECLIAYFNARMARMGQAKN